MALDYDYSFQVIIKTLDTNYIYPTAPNNVVDNMDIALF